jgi:IS30 family transposase
LAQPPSDDVRAELQVAIAQDRKVLGEVYPLLERGMSNQEIARELGRNTPGFVSNNRTHVRAILEGVTSRRATMAGQTAGAVRRVASTPGLSAGARSYLRAVLEELDSAAAVQAPRQQRPSPSAPQPGLSETRGTTLRSQVDETVRTRTDDLTQRIRTEASLDADDYYRACSAAFALDGVEHLVVVEKTSRTTLALHAAGRLDLSIEQAVLDWASDLPLTSDLVKSARSRLAYWKSQ